MTKSEAGVAAPATPAAAVAAAAAPEMFARDAMIAWYRGEFAAANAIIDALCGHIAQISGGGGLEYEAAFAAIHRRRMNWIPVIQMQRFFSIADVAGELKRVAAAKAEASMNVREMIDHEAVSERSAASSSARAASMEGDEEGTEVSSGGDTDQKVHPEEIDGVAGEELQLVQQSGSTEEAQMICSNHEECAARAESIKMRKGFVAREPVKGHMVNVVKGLKVYEDIFTDSELFKLSEFINVLRLAGHRGELSGETFIYFNKQMKGNKREIIQLGVPLFQPTKDDSTSKIEPIPAVLETVIDHLVQWRLIPEGRRPNSCIINFFDEDAYSQPYFKPPHLDNPIFTLVLSETTFAFGCVLASDPNNGNYKGSLTLPLKQGSLLVMRGNSADMARHAICPSDNRRVSITFVRVRPANNQVDASAVPMQTAALTLWQPGTPQPQKVLSPGAIAYGPQGVVPSWGLAIHAPLVMSSPSRPMVMAPGKQAGRGGTGVFLPWTLGPKKYTRHLPPRIQKRRLPPSLPSPIEAM